MIISNKAWHYRFNRFIQGFAFERKADRSRFTTCSYIRTTLFSMMKCLINTVVISLMVASLLAILVCTLAAPVILLVGMTIPEIMVGPFVAGCLMLCVTLVGVVVAGYKYLKERRPNSVVALTDNLVVQYVKDKHNKMCTIVHVKED